MGKQLRFWAATITAIGFTLGLIGCSTSEGNPSATPTTAPPPVSQTPSPSPAPPSEEPTVETVRPDIDIPEPQKYPEMANDDLDGADAAARYFLELYGYAYETGDLKAFNKLSDDECVFCASISERVTSLYADGHWFENFSLLHGDSISYYPTENTPYYVIQLNVVTSAYQHFDSAGELSESAVESHYPEFTVAVRFVSSSEWRVVEGLYGEPTE